MEDPERIVIERPVPGKPHKGKVLLAIQPLGWAERFHYIGPEDNLLEKYINENAIKK